ncbi:nucleotide exchange factor GrpE [Mesobacillus harenae]|uniref:nucleotide exchange factor GrpE n=1 Tax=Mesobacillus harenae TaxID=2213203 RepID=UPI003BB0E93A
MSEERKEGYEEMQTENPASEGASEETFAETGDAALEDENTVEQAADNPAEHRITELEMKLEETENRYFRLQADMENLRRRSRLDLEASSKYRAQNLISDLLPVIDNFERALKMDADNEQAKSILKGMEMVYNGLIAALKTEGAEPIESAGKEFDPHVHQAVMQVEDENFEPNTVVEEFQKGYKLKDRIIRPAMVKVSQ